MKRFSFSGLLAVALSVAVFAVSSPDANAKRVGGGKSVGKGSQVTQRDAAPSAPGAPAGNAGAASAAKAPAAAPAAGAAGAAAQASNRSRWMAPLAGLAAGLGLAALASHLGFGAELANFMMILLLVIVAFAAFKFFMARRAQAANGGMKPAFATASAAPSQPTNFERVQAPSAEGVNSGVYTGGIGSALPSAGLPGIAGFDEAGFVRQSKVNFMRLQASFDAANDEDLREFTSPQMFAELMMEINERKGAANRTEVERLEAELLGQGQDANHQHVSVRFTGSVKEFEGAATMAASSALDETWNFARPANGSEGWTLVGIEQNA